MHAARIIIQECGAAGAAVAQRVYRARVSKERVDGDAVREEKPLS
jgi:hypothetical protein